MLRLPVFLLSATLLLPAAACAADLLPLERGARDIGLSGTVYVTHDSPQDLFGFIDFRGGYYVARGQQLGVGATVFAYSRVQDMYMSGFYRYMLTKGDRRLVPFVGASAGANVSHFDQFGTGRSLMVRGEMGVRYLPGGKCAFDVAYNFMWRDKATVGFTGPTTSILTFGISRTF